MNQGATSAVARDVEAVRAAARKALAAPAGQVIHLALDEAQWLSHLAWLRSAMAAGTLEPGDLTAEEAEGLRVIGEVERELANHTACPRCGALTRSKLVCEACGGKLKG